MPGTALIIAGGARPDPLVVKALPDIDFCVAADGGADHARACGLAVNALVGDLDSVSEGELTTLRSAGIEIDQYPAAKDNTDLELALLRAMATTPDRMIVIGIGGGRVDHELANMAALAADAYSDVPIEGLVGSARLSIIRGARTLAGVLGETVSLLPMHGRATGITTEGLQYPLTDEALEPGSARGVSNHFTAVEAMVTVVSGVLLAVQPFALKDRGAG